MSVNQKTMTGVLDCLRPTGEISFLGDGLSPYLVVQSGRILFLCPLGKVLFFFFFYLCKYYCANLVTFFFCLGRSVFV